QDAGDWQMMECRHRDGSCLNLRRARQQIFDRGERLSLILRGDVRGKREVAVHDCRQNYACILTAELVVDAGMIASEGARPDDRDSQWTVGRQTMIVASSAPASTAQSGRRGRARAARSR